MANDEHVALLKQGVDAWNKWRDENPHVRPRNLFEAADLSGANLIGADLREADLRKANLGGANLVGADLTRAYLTRANLYGADLIGAYLHGAYLIKANLIGASLNGANLNEADLTRAILMGASLNGAILTRANLIEASLNGADLIGADLTRANLIGANLNGANLSGANLIGANLNGASLNGANLNEAILHGANLTAATLVDAHLTGADLTGCRVYGVSAWGLKLDGATQQTNLVITSEGEPEITVDNIEVAQFIYLLLHNEKIRNVIDTIGKKGVLLLGRFTEGRIQILERLREKLRSLGFVPMVFNFDKPETKDFTETVRILAGLSHFVIVDLSYPRSVPLELQAVVPNNTIPFVPIIEQGQDPFGMFGDLQKFDWVLKPVIGYSSVDRLIKALEDEIVRPAEAKFNELLARRAEQLRVEVKVV